MADGNMGSLFMTLGLKDEVSKGLDKIKKNLSLVDEKAKTSKEELSGLMRALKGGDTESMVRSIGRIGEILSKSSTEARHLGTMLSNMKTVDLASMFGKVNATNIGKVTAIVRTFQEELSKLQHKGPFSEILSNVGEKTQKALGILDTVGRINRDISSLNGTIRNMSSPEDAKNLQDLVARMKEVRREYLEIINSGGKGRFKTVSNQYAKIVEEMEAYRTRLSASSDISAPVKKTEAALQGAGTQAVKTGASMKAAGDQIAVTGEQAEKASVSISNAASRIADIVKNSTLSGTNFMSLGLKSEMIDRIDEVISKLRKGGQLSRDIINESKAVRSSIKSADISNIHEAVAGGLSFVRKYNEGVYQSIMYTNELAYALRGIVEIKSRSNGSGLYINIGNIDKAFEQINKIGDRIKSLKSSGSKSSAAEGAYLEKKVNNTLEYLKLLQQIEKLENRIRNHPNTGNPQDKRILGQAMSSINLLKRELASQLFYGGGALVNDSFKGIKKMFNMSIDEIKNSLADLRKNNPLSVYATPIDLFKSKYASTKKMLVDMESLMGSYRGKYASLMDEGAIRSVKSVVGKLDSLVKGEYNGKHTDMNTIDRLLSEIAVAMSQARYAMSDFRSQRRSLMDNDKMARDADKAAASEYNRKKKQSEERLRQIEKESRARQQQQLDQEKADASEYNRKKKQSEERLRQIEKESRALQENAAIQQRLAEKQQKLISSRNSQLERETEIAKARIMSLGRALDKLSEKRHTSKMFGLDTSEADVKLSKYKSQLTELRDILSHLQGKDYTYLGRIGSLGNGRAVSDILGTESQYSQANRQIEKGISLEEKRKQKINEAGAKIQSQLVMGFHKANSEASKLNSTVQDLKSLFMQGGIVFAAQQFAMSIITTGGEMEKQHIAMQSILRDMQNANTMFNQTKELALQSPFTFSELNRDVKQLTAYGVEYEQLYDTTKRLADISAGLGVSFERIALAFGQVRSRGWLDGKELRQISYAGIPLLGKLSEFYSRKEGQKVTTSDVKKMITNREVPFEDVKRIFWDMTDAGGQFYNMQLTLSETLLGRYNKLKDAWEIMLADFARGDSIIGGTFKKTLDAMTFVVQNMHSLGPVIAAAFSGAAIKKLMMFADGGSGSGFLKNKQNLAADIQKRILSGETVSVTERRILATKRLITNEDLRQLANAKAIGMNDLNRLLIAKKITAEQYKQTRNLIVQNTGTDTLRMRYLRLLVTMRGMSLSGMWTNFSTSALASFRFIGNSAKALAGTLWSAIGGLPGLVITSVSMGIMSVVSKYQDLTQNIKQMQDEIANRNKSIAEFIESNNVAKAISSGDTKEIDNMIDSYKDKLKELATYDYSNIVMKADEKSSHEERLKYLEREISLLDEANKKNSTRFADNGNWFVNMIGASRGRNSYSDYKKAIEDVNRSASNMLSAQARSTVYGASRVDAIAFKVSTDAFAKDIAKMKRFISEEFGDISKDGNLKRQAVQAMNNIFSAIGVSDDNANVIRASVLQAFGVYDDGWMSKEVGSRMASVISNTFPKIAIKIKSDQSLNEGEKEKVRELMDDAKKQLTKQYPMLSETIQNLLDRSRFKATIDLVIQNIGGEYNDIQKIMSSRMPIDPREDSTRLYAGKIESWGKEGDWYSARNRAKSEIDLAKNRMESAKLSKDEREKWKKEYEDLKTAAITLLNYDYDGELKKSNKESGSKEDRELKNLKERIDLYKKMYSELKKYESMFGNLALKKLKDDGEFQAIFSDKAKYPINDYSDYEESIRSMLKGLSLTSDERKNYYNDTIADIQSKNREILEGGIDRRNQKLKDELSILEDQFDTYKKIYELTGDGNGAMRLAFGGVYGYDSMEKYLSDQMKYRLDSYNASNGTSFKPEDVFGMDREEFDRAFGKDSEAISVLYDKYASNRSKVNKENLDLLYSVIEKNKTIQQQIDDENAKYERQKKIISGMADKKLRSRAAKGLEKEHGEETSRLRMELFKQDSDWVRIFDDLNMVSTDTINKMIAKVDEYSRSAGHSVEVVKELRDALGRLRDELTDRNPIKGMMESLSRRNAWIDIRKAMGRSESYKLSSSEMKATGSSKDTVTRNDVDGGIRSSGDGFLKALQALSGKIQALCDVLGPINELLESIGAEDSLLGSVLGMTSGSLSSASKVGSGLSALGLGSIAPYGAAIGAGLSAVTSLFGMHDKKLQKEIEASERRQKEMENMSKNVKTIVEKTLGGLYTYKIGKSEKQRLKEITSASGRGVYSKETREAANKAKESGTAFDVQYASMLAQKDELVRQRDAENDKKKTDQSKISEYNQQIKEMDIAIKTFTDDFLSSMYSIDMKSWAQQLTDAVVSAWENGENAVDAYRKKVKDMVKDVTNNIIAQKYIEVLLQKPLEAMEKALSDNGMLNEEDILTLYNAIMSVSDQAVTQITDLMEKFKNSGIDFSEDGSTSAKNSIAGINEQQADLISSLVQGIRLDVSVEREDIRTIALMVKGLPAINDLSRSQLDSLNTLVSLAQSRNNKLDDMYSWMRNLSNGNYSIKVK